MMGIILTDIETILINK